MDRKGISVEKIKQERDILKKQREILKQQTEYSKEASQQLLLIKQKIVAYKIAAFKLAIKKIPAMQKYIQEEIYKAYTDNDNLIREIQKLSQGQSSLPSASVTSDAWKALAQAATDILYRHDQNRTLEDQNNQSDDLDNESIDQEYLTAEKSLEIAGDTGDGY